MKARILEEIVRLSAEQNGKVPGKALFEKETGIKESDWYGKIWVRWSDAIKEAGLTPNSMNERLSNKLILDKYEEVCRHYGKPPTSGELRMYARSQQGFPGHNTFANHYGSKAQLVSALRDRAVERGDTGLIEILPEVVSRPKAETPVVATQNADGWVYLLQSGEYHKIGRSDEVEKRVRQISIALPEKVELVHAIRTDDAPGIEAYWHKRFSDRRANGEWFKLTPTDLRAFKRRKFQ